GDVAAVAADRRLEAGGVPLGPTVLHAEQLGGAGLSIVDEDVVLPVRVARDEIRGVGAEGDEATVLADRGAEAVAVCLLAGAVDADPLGGARLAVANEDVIDAIRVAGNEVRAVGAEGDVAAVAADRRTEAVPAPLGPRAVDADPLG